MDVHSPHIGPGPDVRKHTVFVPWDTPPSPKPGLVPHRKICPVGEPFSHGGFFSAVEDPPLGEKISWKRKNSIKNTRVNAEVQRELSNILRGGIKDPRVSPMTSVVAVEVAPDLKTCKAYISVLGDEKAQQDTIKGLQSAEGFIRRELARTINMRNTPEIKFIVDQSIEYGVNISKKIDEVTKDLKDEAGDIDE